MKIYGLLTVVLCGCTLGNHALTVNYYYFFGLRNEIEILGNKDIKWLFEAMFLPFFRVE